MATHKNNVLAACSLAAVVAVTGCTTVNPYTREEQTSNVAKGSAIGAVVGAAAGAATGSGDKGKRALIGAAIGASAGGGIGYYMDVQEAKLRQQLEGTGVSVSRVGDQIVLNMPSNITFATDSSSLSPSIMPVLDSVVLVLTEYEKTLVNIAGHTDSTGSDSYNQKLSELRAQSVGNYLARGGISANRLVMTGYGESRPVASNASAAGRAQNRRVEITLSPTQG